MEKHYPSSFAGTDLHEYLQKKGVKKLVLTGYMVSFFFCFCFACGCVCAFAMRFVAFLQMVGGVGGSGSWLR